MRGLKAKTECYATVAVTVRQDKDMQKNGSSSYRVAQKRDYLQQKKGHKQRTEDRKHTLLHFSHLAHCYMMIYFLWLSRRKCVLFTFPSSQQKAFVGNERFGYFVHTLLRNLMNITNTTFGTQCWNFCFTHISACPWKRYFARKLWSEAQTLVISHWTSHATKNEPAYEKKTQSPTTSRIS